MLKKGFVSVSFVLVSSLAFLCSLGITVKLCG